MSGDGGTRGLDLRCAMRAAPPAARHRVLLRCVCFCKSALLLLCAGHHARAAVNWLHVSGASTWHNNGDAAADIVYYHFDEKQVLTGFRWQCHTAWGTGSAINAFDLAVSTVRGEDGPWITLTTSPTTGEKSCDEDKNMFTVEPVAARSVRLTIKSNFQASYATSIDDIYFEVSPAWRASVGHLAAFCLWALVACGFVIMRYIDDRYWRARIAYMASVCLGDFGSRTPLPPH